MKRIAVLFLFSASLFAQLVDIRPVPPPGVAVSPEDKKDLEAGLKRLAQAIEKLQDNPLLPDVQIFHEAARYALTYNEFFKQEDIFKAKELLRQGQIRAAQLEKGEAPWTTATGLVVRGYISKIDKSVQPYGLVVPPTYSPSLPHQWRLDAWFHGRGETLSEVNFLTDRMRNPGEFTPPNTIVVHLYGRYCNANRFAGEVDFFEALDAIKRHYPIDENRILIRGFSMGGAAVWHIAAHHAGLFAAAAPGAGFSETADFLKIWDREKIKPTWWEQKLWHLYDATDDAANFYNIPLVTYSGEIDGQKQAADVMAKALAAEGMQMTHIIGPNTPHRYHPDSKPIINAKLDAIAALGRDAYPRKIRFTTWSLAYNQMKWVTIDSLEQHWERASLDAEIIDDNNVNVKTSGVSAFTLDIGSGGSPLNINHRANVTINGQKVAATTPMTDHSWLAHFRKTGTQWASVDKPVPADGNLHKIHNLQGPIDDAFLDSFLVVRPTGAAMIPAVSEWLAKEQAHMIDAWRKQFRGDAQVRDDSQIGEAEIANSNLVLFGDPGSNKVLARILGKLPLQWSKDSLVVAKKSYSSATNIPVMIYPNPLNPKKYIVINSGFTFREYDYLNNARQTPKLPDYAVVDITTPADGRFPGKIVDAGFFNEQWQFKPSQNTQHTRTD
ncbi:MAG: prolyl oligopeptidase family serine peptidase [Bryobacteraceae bacterium]